MIPTPVVLGLTLCDCVIVEEGTQKVSLIGTFTRIGLRQFPAVAPPFSVYTRMTDGVGDATLELILVRLDTVEEVYRFRAPAHFANKLAEMRFHARLPHCSFPAPGHYQFTLLVDGEWVAQRRLLVYQQGGHS